MSDTIAALATGAQISAIGILRLSGPESIAIADRLFIPDDGTPMSAHESKTLVYGALHDTDGALLDLCLCTHSRAPRSYTGEDTVEFQCHGSPVVLREALEACFSLGARQAGPGEFTKRAFLNGCMDLTAAEAVASCPARSARASTRSTARWRISARIITRCWTIRTRISKISGWPPTVKPTPGHGRACSGCWIPSGAAV